MTRKTAPPIQAAIGRPNGSAGINALSGIADGGDFGICSGVIGAGWRIGAGWAGAG